MIRIIIILFLITNVALAQQQQYVRLNDCYESMLVNYPLTNQSEIYKQSSDLSIQNMKAAWLPNAELKAQASYQSDAITVEILALGYSFGFEAEKDQYKASIDVNQLIYDWGRIKSAKQLENVNLKVNQQNTQVELNKIKEQINKFYFAILILQRNEELLGVMLNDLEIREKSVESGVKNGVLLSSDLSALKAEKIRAKQSILEIRNQRFATIDVMSEITGLNLSYEAEFKIPEYDLDSSESIIRPELILFNYQKEKLDATSGLVSKQNKPTVFAFTQLGYGKPGLNMVNDQFDAYYYVGVGLSWKFWDWSKTKREKQILSLNKDLISTHESSFNKQVEIALKNESSKIYIYTEAIESDKEIIKLREEVSESARSKLDNGIITSTDYITELSKETQAKINYETHKIQLVQSKVNYLYIKGEI
ncbi:MAG: TolC family protein [Bacteroidales bacterium]|nr:TolC family protein [Bacteroidales bacterium]